MSSHQEEFQNKVKELLLGQNVLSNNVYITSFSASVESWSILMNVLKNPQNLRNDQNILCFISNIIYSKSIKQWNQINQAERQVFINDMFTIIFNEDFINFQKFYVERIISSIITLSLRIEDGLMNLISKSCNMLLTTENYAKMMASLKLLSFIPDELESIDCSRQLKIFLGEILNSVIFDLLSCLESNVKVFVTQIEMIVCTINVLTKWLKYIKDIRKFQFQCPSLFQLTFSVLSHQDTAYYGIEYFNVFSKYYCDDNNNDDFILFILKVISTNKLLIINLIDYNCNISSEIIDNLVNISRNCKRVLFTKYSTPKDYIDIMLYILNFKVKSIASNSFDFFLEIDDISKNSRNIYFNEEIFQDIVVNLFRNSLYCINMIDHDDNSDVEEYRDLDKGYKDMLRLCLRYIDVHKLFQFIISLPESFNLVESWTKFEFSVFITSVIIDIFNEENIEIVQFSKYISEIANKLFYISNDIQSFPLLNRSFCHFLGKLPYVFQMNNNETTVISFLPQLNSHLCNSLQISFVSTIAAKSLSSIYLKWITHVRENNLLTLTTYFSNSIKLVIQMKSLTLEVSNLIGSICKFVLGIANTQIQQEYIIILMTSIIAKIKSVSSILDISEALQYLHQVITHFDNDISNANKNIISESLELILKIFQDYFFDNKQKYLLGLYNILLNSTNFSHLVNVQMIYEYVLNELRSKIVSIELLECCDIFLSILNYGRENDVYIENLVNLIFQLIYSPNVQDTEMIFNYDLEILTKTIILFQKFQSRLPLLFINSYFIPTLQLCETVFNLIIDHKTVRECINLLNEYLLLLKSNAALIKTEISYSTFKFDNLLNSILQNCLFSNEYVISLNAIDLVYHIFDTFSACGFYSTPPSLNFNFLSDYNEDFKSLINCKLYSLISNERLFKNYLREIKLVESKFSEIELLLN